MVLSDTKCEFDRSAVAASYEVKLPEFEEKYGVGYYTHIHTGFYDRADQPALFEVDSPMERWGLGRLRYLLHRGQERLTALMCAELGLRPLQHVLDCGTGHGGTAIFLAEHYRAHVCGVTVAPRQLPLLKEKITAAGVGDRVQVRLYDIFEKTLPAESFDAIIATDALCQMGNPGALFAELARLLRPGGRLVIGDYFLCRAGHPFEPIFNAHWTSRLTTLADTLASMLGAGLLIQEISNISENQMPFWRLSIAHTRLMLESHASTAEIAERLQRRVEVHTGFVRAFEDEGLGYMLMSLRRRSSRASSAGPR